MINNKEIKVEDLLTNESFQSFISKTNKTDIKYWESWIKSNPSKVDIIIEAKEILNQIEFRKKTIAFDIIEKDYEQLFKKISNKKINIMPNTHIDKKSKKHTSLHIKIAAFIICPLLIGSIANFFYQCKTQIAKTSIVEFYVPSGQKSELFFPDGTHVILNSNTRIKYPLNFSKRIIQLNGEAYFDVAKNKNRPFIVLTSKLELQVLGTNVNAFSFDNSIKTTLIEGEVLIKSISKDHILKNEIILTPNHLASYNKDDDKFKIDSVDAILSTSWIKGELILKSTSFNKQIKLFERRHNAQIFYNPSDFSSIKFNGSFENKTVKEAMQALSIVYKFSYKINEIIININK